MGVPTISKVFPACCRVREEYQDLDVESESEAPRTVYYQWVIFFLALQAILFALPYKLWKGAEAGVLRGFNAPEAR